MMHYEYLTSNLICINYRHTAQQIQFCDMNEQTTHCTKTSHTSNCFASNLQVNNQRLPNADLQRRTFNKHLRITYSCDKSIEYVDKMRMTGSVDTGVCKVNLLGTFFKHVIIIN